MHDPEWTPDLRLGTEWESPSQGATSRSNPCSEERYGAYHDNLIQVQKKNRKVEQADVYLYIK